MQNPQTKVFDYRALRFLMGLIALSLPFIVIIVSKVKLTSISASYYSDARDIFVGFLFMIGTFLFAYNGHTLKESFLSKIACLAAVFVALFPTNCDGCAVSRSAYVHVVSAMVLFSILTYFCFVPFLNSARSKPGKKSVMRGKIYILCGWTMIGCMTGVFLSNLAFPKEILIKLRITYFGEFIALLSFGIAWIVSGQTSKLFTEKQEVYHILEDLMLLK